MLKKLFLSCALLMTVTGLTVGVDQAQSADKKETVNVLSGTVGGPWFVGFGAFTKGLMKNLPNADVNLIAGGSVSNCIRVSSGEGTVSISQHSIVQASVNGEPPFKQKCPNLLSVANMRETTYLNFVVRADLPIKSFEDIKNQKYPLRLAHGPIGTASEMFGKRVFEKYGISFKDIKAWGGKLFANNYSDVSNMFKDNQIDMFIWNGQGQSEGAFVKEASLSVPMRWLPVKEEYLDEIGKKHGTGKGTMKAGLYNGMLGPNILTLTDTAEVFVNKNVSDEIAYAIAKTIYEYREDLKLAYPNWGDYVPETAAQGMYNPLHPGAAKFYREKGWLK